MDQTKISIGINNKTVFTFPITPGSFEIHSDTGDETVNINGLGEILLKGTPNLREVSWSSFFPRERYDFCAVTEAEFLAHDALIEKLEKWRNKRTTVTVNITNVISVPVVVTSFEHGQDDGTTDINYSLTFKEDKNVSTPSSQEQTAERPTKDVESHMYKWKKGDTWKKVAKKETGKSENWTKIKKSNASRVDAAVKAYKKKHPDVKTVKDEVALIGEKILIK